MPHKVALHTASSSTIMLPTLSLLIHELQEKVHTTGTLILAKQRPTFPSTGLFDLLPKNMSIDQTTEEEEATVTKKFINIEPEVHAFVQEQRELIQWQMQEELRKTGLHHEDLLTLHNLLRGIQQQMDEKGALNISNNKELQQLLQQAHKLGAGVDPKKFVYTKTEREALVNNLRLTSDDRKLLGDMGSQRVARFMNQLNEIHQIAQKILEIISQAKKRMAHGIGG